MKKDLKQFLSACNAFFGLIIPIMSLVSFYFEPKIMSMGIATGLLSIFFVWLASYTIGRGYWDGKLAAIKAYNKDNQDAA